jgi:hypothetical protein
MAQSKFLSLRNPLITLVVLPLLAMIAYAVAYEAGWISRDARIDHVNSANPHLSIRPTGVGELFEQKHSESGSALYFALSDRAVRLAGPVLIVSCAGFLPKWFPVYPGKTSAPPRCLTVPLEGGGRSTVVNFWVAYADRDAPRDFYAAALTDYKKDSAARFFESAPRFGDPDVASDPQWFQDDYAHADGRRLTLYGLRRSGWGDRFQLAVEFKQ